MSEATAAELPPLQGPYDFDELAGVADLVSWIATQTLQGDSTSKSEAQLTEALEAMIDARIAAWMLRSAQPKVQT